jgi:hypothetical protein
MVIRRRERTLGRPRRYVTYHPSLLLACERCVACGGDWMMTDPEGLRYIRTLVEGAREYVRHTAGRPVHAGRPQS